MKKILTKIDIDWSIVVTPVLLLLCSLSTLYGISSFGVKSDILQNQLIFIGAGVILYFLSASFDYRRLAPISPYLFVAGIVFLIAVELFGQSVFGSKRWIDIGFFRFQPSEMMKLFTVLFSAFYFQNIKNSNFKTLIKFFLYMLVPTALIVQQPDLGTSLVMIIIMMTAIFSSPLPRKILIIVAALSLLLLPIGWLSLKDYQKQRLVSFVNPEQDPLGSGYNVRQSKITVGSGGFYGKGFGEATQSQLQFLPVSHIDFIFAGFAEATGFIGSSFMVFLFAFLIYRIFSIAISSKDRFGYIVCNCIGVIFAFQSFVNIGMNIGLMPVTGIPLPFVSYGGTSLIISSILLGLCQSVFLRRRSLRFD
ncbi:MAG: Rod shape-determining protein RodA [candidate division WS2 bacterium ADurb.Bin280]|uniref:Rod shape-determining protein RodA n=1 Tax=candidate division WS2 bacterium ADurb.Bin280 TaxID=1852829 RepID=A0A1V5SDN0_9BACT|nr:MAG: Rod shape-determining protein RodA [candidate division WS2 bacterium ADurb.Bin280]